MDKQELIEKFEEKLKDVQIKFGASFKTKVYEELLEDLRQLDEPQKIRIPQGIVPQGIANYIEYTKTNEWDLLEAMDNVAYEEDKELRKWFNNNSENFAIAWIFGYEVEKENRYRVKMKGVDSRTKYLYYGMGSKSWLFKEKLIDGLFRKSHTRKQLEEAGFGDVFNSPLFEVEEVLE